MAKSAFLQFHACYMRHVVMHEDTKMSHVRQFFINIMCYFRFVLA